MVLKLILDDSAHPYFWSKSAELGVILVSLTTDLLFLILKIPLLYIFDIVQENGNQSLVTISPFVLQLSYKMVGVPFPTNEVRVNRRLARFCHQQHQVYLSSNLKVLHLLPFHDIDSV